MGASILTSSNNLYEEIIDYSNCTQSKCYLTHKLTSDVDKLYVYYQLDGFRQNHQAYAKSKSWDQLKSGIVADKETTCKPKERDADGVPYLPCGSVPNSMFNDSISVSGINLTETGIVHEEYKSIFTNNITKNVNASHYNVLFEDLTNEHVANWFLISPTANTRKLYGIINKKLDKGTELSIEINNLFPVTSSYKKQIVLATTNFLGGKNPFFGIFFICLCVLSAIAAVTFLVLYFLNVLPLYHCRKASSTMDITLIP
jgi:hypothetical protein